MDELKRQNDWRKGLMRAGEREAYDRRNFVIDADTGDILAKRPTPYQMARLEGYDWHALPDDLSDFDEDVVLELPESFYEKTEDDDDGSIRR